MKNKLKKFFKVHPKHWCFLAAAVFLTCALVWLTNFPVKAAYSNSHLVSIAQKYTQRGEQAIISITINYRGRDYYYIPFEINGSITSFPGLMLDRNANPVTDTTKLKELFRYPGVLTEFSSSRRGFDSLVSTKAQAIAQYCRILNRQESDLQKMVAAGYVAAVPYEGAKIAFAGVGMVKTGVQGLGAFVQDLATGEVQDAILDYFLPTDSTKILESASRAHLSAKNAVRSCQRALQAWQSLKTTSGVITPEKARNATYELYKMFESEQSLLSHLRDALRRVNQYPQIITKIGQRDYTAGMTSLGNLIRQISNEARDWRQESQDASTFLNMWTNEQISRVSSTPVGPPSSTNCHVGSKGSWSYCTTACPCDSGQGDCDGNSECKGSLKCVDNVGTQYGWNWSVDVCEGSSGGASSTTPSSPSSTVPPPSSTSSNCHIGSKGNWSYCTTACPCDSGQGDCDGNTECKGSLKCVDNVGTQYGWNWSVDVCK